VTIENYYLILASNSPRRRQLLGLVSDTFSVQTGDVDERLLPHESPPEYVLRLAENKAQAVSISENESSLVVAADTTVVDRGEIIGKPTDAKEAERTLRRLRGRIHQVLTGLAVFRPLDKLLVAKLITTEVSMRNYSDKEIEEYIASGDPFDKAGAYAVQNEKFHPVSDFEDCFANVMGFPLCHFMVTLKVFDISINEEVPLKCQKSLGYSCPIFEQVLSEEK